MRRRHHSSDRVEVLDAALDDLAERFALDENAPTDADYGHEPSTDHPTQRRLADPAKFLCGGADINKHCHRRPPFGLTSEREY
jgi:hypothetical protein